MHNLVRTARYHPHTFIPKHFDLGSSCVVVFLQGEGMYYRASRLNGLDNSMQLNGLAGHSAGVRRIKSIRTFDVR